MAPSRRSHLHPGRPTRRPPVAAASGKSGREIDNNPATGKNDAIPAREGRVACRRPGCHPRPETRPVMRLKETMSRAALGMALFAVSLAPLWPNWIDRSLPASHEVYRYSALADMFSDALWSGVLYPRWMPD